MKRLTRLSQQATQEHFILLLLHFSQSVLSLYWAYLPFRNLLFPSLLVSFAVLILLSSLLLHSGQCGRMLPTSNFKNKFQNTSYYKYGVFFCLRVFDTRQKSLQEQSFLSMLLQGTKYRFLVQEPRERTLGVPKIGTFDGVNAINPVYFIRETFFPEPFAVAGN